MQESCRILKAFKINRRDWMTSKAEVTEMRLNTIVYTVYTVLKFQTKKAFVP